MTALWIALACWLGVLATFVALRARATLHRPTPVRRRMRTAQMRALRARTSAAGSTRSAARTSAALLAAGPRR